jgi:hypothetical protein
MRRREFISLLSGAVTAWPHPAEADVRALTERRIMEYRRSDDLIELLGLDVGRADHLAPLLGFVGDEFLELDRCH